MNWVDLAGRIAATEHEYYCRSQPVSPWGSTVQIWKRSNCKIAH